MLAYEAPTKKLHEVVAALCNQRKLRDAVDLLLSHETPADYLSFTCLIQTCGSTGAILEARQVHSHLTSIIHSFSEECKLIIRNHLIRMYDQCGAVSHALQVFHSMPVRNRVSWNLMLAAYARASNGQDAFRLMHEMQCQSVRPDKYSFISLLSALRKSECVLEGKIAHSALVCDMLDEALDLGNGLITFYGMLGLLDDAMRTLEIMPKRNVISWNAMLSASCQSLCYEMIFLLYTRMQQEDLKPNKVTFITLLSACSGLSKLEEGKHLHSLIKLAGVNVDVVLGTALVDMYSKCGDFDSAMKVFTQMPAGNDVSWTAIISAHVKHGHSKEACALFGEMQKEGVKGNAITLLALLESCADSGNLAYGKLLHACIIEDPDGNDNVVKNALISMYNRCGSLDDAQWMFNSSNVLDTVSWNAMISANSQHGNSEKTIDLFKRMQMKGVKPTDNSFISILSACSHTGMLSEGILCFEFMFEEFHILPLPQHYTCIIDLLGRSGQLNQAEMFVDEIPIQPGILEWMSLVTTSRVHGNMERAISAAKYALELDPLVTGAYVALSNILSLIASIDDECTSTMETCNCG